MLKMHFLANVQKSHNISNRAHQAGNSESESDLRKKNQFLLVIENCFNMAGVAWILFPLLILPSSKASKPHDVVYKDSIFD